jgi:hypothetical protein
MDHPTTTNLDPICAYSIPIQRCDDSPFFEIRDSLIHGAGQGLFSRAMILPHTNLGYYVGEGITSREAADLPHVENQSILRIIQKPPWMHRGMWSKIKSHEGACLNATAHARNYLQKVNHSTTPNIAFGPDGCAVSITGICPGDELTVDYGIEYWTGSPIASASVSPTVLVGRGGCVTPCESPTATPERPGGELLLHTPEPTVSMEVTPVVAGSRAQKCQGSTPPATEEHLVVPRGGPKTRRAQEGKGGAGTDNFVGPSESPYPPTCSHLIKGAIMDMVRLSLCYQLHAETCQLAVHLFHSVLALRRVHATKLPTLGAAAVWSASKYNEVTALMSQNCIQYMKRRHHTCTPRELVNMERILLQVVDYRLALKTAFTYAEILSKDSPPRIRAVAGLLAETSLGCAEAVPLSRKAVGAACVFLAYRECAVVPKTPLEEEGMMEAVDAIVSYTKSTAGGDLQRLLMERKYAVILRACEEGSTGANAPSVGTKRKRF